MPLGERVYPVPLPPLPGCIARVTRWVVFVFCIFPPEFNAVYPFDTAPEFVYASFLYCFFISKTHFAKCWLILVASFSLLFIIKTYFALFKLYLASMLLFYDFFRSFMGPSRGNLGPILAISIWFFEVKCTSPIWVVIS